MRKRCTDLVGSILFHTLILSCIPLILPISNVVPVCNARSSFSLGSQWNFTAEEQTLDSAVAGFIANLAALRSWEHAQNYYGSGTTAIRTFVCAGGNGDTYAISFYIGHGLRDYYPSGSSNIHYFITDNGGSPIWDFLIYQCTAQRRTKFVVLWSCYQAGMGDWGSVGGPPGGFYNPSDPTTEWGMPLGWLHTTNLNYNGYANPDGRGYAFIGFHNTDGPQLRYADPVFGVQQAGYNFLLNFYSSALHYRNPLNRALDSACHAVWNIPSFEGSPYDGYRYPERQYQMVLYGDGNLVLP